MGKKTHYGRYKTTNISPVHKSFDEGNWSKPPCGLDYTTRITSNISKVTCTKCLRALAEDKERKLENCNISNIVN